MNYYPLSLQNYKKVCTLSKDFTKKNGLKQKI